MRFPLCPPILCLFLRFRLKLSSICQNSFIHIFFKVKIFILENLEGRFSSFLEFLFKWNSQNLKFNNPLHILSLFVFIESCPFSQVVVSLLGLPGVLLEFRMGFLVFKISSCPTFFFGNFHRGRGRDWGRDRDRDLGRGFRC